MNKTLDHEYDGIREYDNPLPGWWNMIFYVSIVFAIVYFIVFQIGGWVAGPAQKYKADELAWLATHEAESATLASASEAQLEAGAQDPALLDRGRSVFTTKCASCHVADGRGLIGPNLTDNHQIHGKKREDLFLIIRDGAPGTAMMGWSTQIPSSDLVAVATFAASLRGKNLPGKEPQGKPIQ